MAGVNIIPVIVLVFLGALSVLGARQKPIDLPKHVLCAYQLADLERPAADIVFVGSSRIGRGIDPGYMMSRIASRSGKDISIERLALTRPNIPQFRPLLARYIAQRGAPRHVVLQLLYNFKPDRQRTWDLPVNNGRNLAFADLDELREIRASAKLNEYDTVLPRTLEAGYRSLPALVLQKVETNIFSALRWPAKQLTGTQICPDSALPRQSQKTWLYNNVSDDMTFEDTPEREQRRIRDYKISGNFLPMSPNHPFRQFETDQLRDLIEILEAAGSSVTLMILPALGDTELSQAERDEIAAAFPGYPLLHPYDLFKTGVGPNLGKSFADTHHATPYGALLYSRYFADALLEFDF